MKLLYALILVGSLAIPVTCIAGDCPPPHTVQLDTSSSPAAPVQDETVFVANVGGGSTGSVFITRYVPGVGPDGRIPATLAATLAARGLVSRKATVSFGGSGFVEHRCNFDRQHDHAAWRPAAERLRVTLNNEDVTDCIVRPASRPTDSGDITVNGEVVQMEIDIDKLYFPTQKGVNGALPTPSAANVISVDLADQCTGQCEPLDGCFYCYFRYTNQQLAWIKIEFQAAAPLVLVHGLTTSSAIWHQWDITRELDSSGNVVSEGFLGRNFIPYATVQVERIGSIQTNAGRLAERVKNEVRNFGAFRAHLVCHSKGGLDARRFLNQYYDHSPDYGPPDDKYYPYPNKRIEILSLHTLGSPHHGSILADLMVRRRNGRADYLRSLNNHFIDVFLRNDGVAYEEGNEAPQGPGLEDTQVQRMGQLNLSGKLTVPSGIPVYTYSGDADLDNDQRITQNEASGQFEGIKNVIIRHLFEGSAGNTNYQVLAHTTLVSVVRAYDANGNPILPGGVVSVLDGPPLLNDLAVTDRSSRLPVFCGNEVEHAGPFDKNHSKLRDRDLFKEILKRVCCLTGNGVACEDCAGVVWVN